MNPVRNMAQEGYDMEADTFPKLKESVYINDTFADKNGRGYWVIGDKESDTQVVIEAKDVPFFQKLMENLNGKEDIKQLVQKEVGSYAQINAGLQLLTKYGFLQGTEGKKSYNEAESLSVKLIKKTFGELGEKKRQRYQRLSKRILSASKIVFGISMIFFVILLGMNVRELAAETSPSYWFSYSSGGVNHVFTGYLLVNLSMLVMFGIHELFHMMAGLEKGIQPSCFSFILFLGFLPMFYVKNKNIYSLPKKDILKVLLAGVYANLMLFFLFMDLFLLWEAEWLKILAVANLKMVFVNLIPLSLTDGYFIYTLLFNRPNLRMRFHQFLGRPEIIREYGKRDLCYAVLFISTILLMINSEVLWIIGGIKVHALWKVSFVLLFDMGYLLSLHFLDKKTFLTAKV